MTSESACAISNRDSLFDVSFQDTSISPARGETGPRSDGAVGAVGTGEMVFDNSAGLLYQLNFGGRIISIDPVTGKSTLVGTVAVGPGDTVSLAVVPGAHTIYVGQTIENLDTGGFDYDIVTFDTLTGAISTSPVNPGRLGFLADGHVLR